MRAFGTTFVAVAATYSALCVIAAVLVLLRRNTQPVREKERKKTV